MEDQPQYSFLLDYEIVTLATGEKLLIVNPAKSYCLERMYHIGEDYIGPSSEAKLVDFSNCSRILGQKADSYQKTVKWGKEIVEAYKKSKENAKKKGLI